MRIAPFLVAVCFVSSVTLSACGGGDDDTSSTTTEPLAGQIDTGLDPVDLPDEFPSDVPLPAGLVILDAPVLSGGTIDLYEVTGWHEGDPVEVANDYLAELERIGYEVVSRTDTPNNLFFIAQSDDWFVSAGFFPDPIRLEGTSVGITVGPASDASSG
jgi:hypothetical protein